MLQCLGWGLVLLALVSLALGLLDVAPSLGTFGHRLDPNLIVGLQGFVDQRLDPDPGDPTLWFDYGVPLLGVSVYYALAVVAALAGCVLLVWSLIRRR